MKKGITKKGLTLWINEKPSFSRKIVQLPIERDPYEITRGYLDEWIKQKRLEHIRRIWTDETHKK